MTHTSLAWRVARASLLLSLVVLLSLGVYLSNVAPELAWVVALVVGLAAATGAVLAVRLAKSVSDPIKRLTHLAGQMAAGDLDARFRGSGSDEIGELGRAFNRMATRLQEQIATLSSERNQFAAILKTVTDGLVIVDTRGCVLQMNPAAERLLRVTAKDVAGEPFITVGRDHELAELLNRSDGRAQLVDIGLPRRQVRAVAAAMPGAQGERVLLLQDVTELRRLELVRRDFVTNVSHELRTPLAAVKAIVETLEDGALAEPPVAREFLGRLHQEVDEMTGLVRELLELSRIESGQLDLDLQRVNVLHLLQSSADRLRPLAERAEIELRIDVPAGLPDAQADYERVRQVLTNLVHNAIKFTPAGGTVTLRACLASDLPDSARAAQHAGSGRVGARRWVDDLESLAPQVAISIVDTGIGIPPDQLDRVFERFFKADPSRSSGGTGLGLAIAKHLVQAHGGRIWARSSGSRGTSFTFTLPCAPRPAEATDSQPSVTIELADGQSANGQERNGREAAWPRS